MTSLNCLTVSLVTDWGPAGDPARRSGPRQVQRAGHSAASLVQVSPALDHLVQYIPIYQDQDIQLLTVVN